MHGPNTFRRATRSNMNGGLGKEPVIQKGKPFGRILRTKTVNGRKMSLHATKGWRLGE